MKLSIKSYKIQSNDVLNQIQLSKIFGGTEVTRPGYDLENPLIDPDEATS
ncbi:hypothetical protein [Aquimarina pacifica]|nr:hypothetical protein [Aquimarina pacifica]